MVKRFRKNGVLYSFYLWDAETHNGYKNYITLAVTGSDFERVHNIPVHDCDGFRVRINKKSCTAAGGARGLFSFIADCINSDFMMDWVYKIIRNFDRVTL